MKKIFYIVLDGLGDTPSPSYNNQTPLSLANTPFLDSLAKEGALGLVYPVEKDIAPESDIAVISLLGYDAHKVYTGRGPLESFAEGIEVNDGDLALRVNFATIDKDTKKIIDRRVGRNLTTEEAEALSKEINSKVKLNGANFIFKNTIGHRGVLVIKKEGKLSGWITNTDPAYDREGVFGIAKEEFSPYLLEAKPMPGYENDQSAILSSSLLNEFTEKSHDVLEDSEINKIRRKKGYMPANVILSRDAGDRLPKFVPIKENTSMRFGCFVQMPVEKGIAMLCGMDIIEVPLPSGDLSKDYSLWAEKAAKSIYDYDGLYIHIKGPDEPGHDGNFNKKKEIIELIDKYFFGLLLSQIKKEDFIIAVTADHSTPVSLKAHSSDPVPLLICGDIKDATEKFSEEQAKKGLLGTLLGRELIYLLVKYAKG